MGQPFVSVAFGFAARTVFATALASVDVFAAAFGAAFEASAFAAVVFGAALPFAVDVFAAAFGAALAAAVFVVFAAAALGAAFAVDAFAVELVDRRVAGFADASADASGAVAVFAAASERAVFERAARAFPAAVCAPFAFAAFDAATRALAALTAAALPVLFVTRVAVCTDSPPRAALTLRVSRDFRRAAAFGWIAPAFAARSSALSAAARASRGSPSACWVATLSALATNVFAAVRRGLLISVRRSAVRTRLMADGVRAPVQPRGFVAKFDEPQVRMGLFGGRRTGPPDTDG